MPVLCFMPGLMEEFTVGIDFLAAVKLGSCKLRTPLCLYGNSLTGLQHDN